MQSRRFVVVGTRVQRTDQVALLGAAQEAGIDVRVAAQRPPQGAVGQGAVGQGSLSWHRVVDPRAAEGVGGLLGSWVTRAVRGAAVPLAEQLGADGWLEAQLTDQPADQLSAVEAGAEVLLVALDDTATQALARWRATAGSGREVPVLTWDQGAEALAEEVAAAWRQDDRAALVPSTDEPDADDPARPLGARHTITLMPSPGTDLRPGVEAALRHARTALTVGGEGPLDLAGADVLVLDGLGPAVLALRTGAGPRVVHLRRATDRRSPWRHLLDPARVDAVVDAHAVEALAGADEGPDLLATALDPATAGLLRAPGASGDDVALALAAELLGADDPTPALLRELSFLTRVTGALGLEREVLRRQPPSAQVEQALAAVEDTLRETEPGWLPQLDPPAPDPTAPDPTAPDPVPGRVLHLLKVTLPQRQAGYSVRGHHTLRALVEAGVDVVGVAAPAPLPGVDGSDAEIEEVVLDGVRYLVPPPVRGGAGGAGGRHTSSSRRRRCWRSSGASGRRCCTCTPAAAATTWGWSVRRWPGRAGCRGSTRCAGCSSRCGPSRAAGPSAARPSPAGWPRRPSWWGWPTRP